MNQNAKRAITETMIDLIRGRKISGDALVMDMHESLKAASIRALLAGHESVEGIKQFIAGEV